MMLFDTGRAMQQAFSFQAAKDLWKWAFRAQREAKTADELRAAQRNLDDARWLMSMNLPRITAAPRGVASS
jgi:hypothetical protein